MADKPNHEQPDDLTIAEAAKRLALSAEELETAIGRTEIAVALTAEGERRVDVEELQRFIDWEKAIQLRGLKEIAEWSNENELND